MSVGVMTTRSLEPPLSRLLLARFENTRIFDQPPARLYLTQKRAHDNLLKIQPFSAVQNQTLAFEMSYSSRPLPSHLRQGSNSNPSSGQSPILLARINEKKAELENLKQLRDLSAGLAGQMQMLEEKLATLSDGAEGMRLHIVELPTISNPFCIAVATVLGNWHNVLQAISMASSKLYLLAIPESHTNKSPVKIPKPKEPETEESEADESQKKTELELPQTLVRIPTEHAPMLRQQTEGAEEQ